MLTKVQLLSQATSTGAGAAAQAPVSEHPDFLRSFQAGMVGGTSATVNIEFSDDNRTWIVAGTITLAAGEADGLSSSVPWRFVRANVTAISGGGAVDAAMVVQG